MRVLSVIGGFLLIGFLFFFSDPCFGQSKDENFYLNTWDYLSYSKPDSLFLQLKEQYQNAVKEENVSLQGTSLKNMGEVCYHLGHYARAMEYYLEARKLFEKEKREDLLADIYNNLGTLYYYNRDTIKARQSYGQAMVLFVRLKNQEGIAITMGEIGHLAEKKQQYDSAFLYQRKALAVYRSINNKTGTAKIYENIGSIYEDLSAYDSAMYYFRSALDVYHESAAEVASIEVINNIGDIYRKTGNLSMGLFFSLKALDLARLHNELYQMSSASRDVSKVYHLMGKNDSAFYYAEITRSYLLDIYTQEGNKQIAFLQALDETERKNARIMALQNEKRINAVVGIAILLIVVLLVVAGLSVISRQKLKLRAEQEVSKQSHEIYEASKKLMEADLKTAALEEGKLKAELNGKQLEKEKLDAELRTKALEEEQLKQQIEAKSKDLMTHALHIIQKNQLLEALKGQLEEMVKDDRRDQKKQLRQLIVQITQNFNNDGYWDEFSKTFGHIHQSFFENLNQRYPDLTANDLRLVSLLKINMASPDMAAMLGISLDSLRVSRYRLRKKMDLDQGENLVAFLQSF